MFRFILDFLGLLASIITVAEFLRDLWPRFSGWLKERAPTDGSEDLH